MQVLFIWLAVVLTIGITLAVVMGRRGHSAFEWFLIGLILGPFVLLLAWGRVRFVPASLNREIRCCCPRDRHRAGRCPRRNRRVGGIGDGAPDGGRALGPRIGRLTLAGVTEFDYGSSQAQADTKRALEVLRAIAESASVSAPGVGSSGVEPAEALSEHALRDGYQLLVVGHRGRGASKAILGSTAAQLASAPIPVLVAAGAPWPARSRESMRTWSSSARGAGPSASRRSCSRRSSSSGLMAAGYAVVSQRRSRGVHWELTSSRFHPGSDAKSGPSGASPRKPFPQVTARLRRQLVPRTNGNRALSPAYG